MKIEIWKYRRMSLAFPDKKFLFSVKKIKTNKNVFSM